MLSGGAVAIFFAVNGRSENGRRFCSLMAESHTYSKRRISSPERLRHPSRPAQREPFLFLEIPMSELTLTRFATRLRVSLAGWRCRRW